MSRFETRFFASTRGKIVVLLRRARHTVDELASALGLTDNAVRAHLATLERDGLVQQHGVRRGEGKPASVYELTTEAKGLFPNAHAPVLGGLLKVLEERTSRDDMASAMREVGQRLAANFPVAKGSPRARLEAAGRVLASLGGLAEVEATDNGELRLIGYSCPLGSIVKEHPQACLAAEALVASVADLPVAERCERDEEHPRCRFVVESADG